MTNSSWLSITNMVGSLGWRAIPTAQPLDDGPTTEEPLLDDLKSLKKLVVGVRRSKREVKMVKQDAL